MESSFRIRPSRPLTDVIAQSEYLGNVILTAVVFPPPSWLHAWPMRTEVDMYLSEVVISFVWMKETVQGVRAEVVGGRG